MENAVAMLFVDLETRSKADLQTVGPRRYATDESTQITTAVWYFNGTMKTACPIYPQLGTHLIGELFSDLYRCDRIVAHHVGFDANVLQGQNPFLNIPVTKVSCTMARAQCLSLPGGLDQLCAALNIPGKDKRGRALVMKTCKPMRDGKFWEAEQTFRELLEYNVQDVRCLMQVHSLLPELNANERAIFERSWRKNDIGLPIDIELATAIALRRAAIEAEAAVQLREITGGIVTAITQRARIMNWANGGNRVANLSGTQKHQVAEALENPDLHPDVRIVLEILRADGGSAPMKAQALLDRHVNGYYKDATRYHGARSGRGTSEGANLFNIARPSNKYDVEEVITGLKAGFAYDNLALTDALRGCIVAPAGWALIDNDLSNAELRIALWQAGDGERLNILASGSDLYMHNAIRMWGLPQSATQKTHPAERQNGKNITLGSNYQLGWKTYKAQVRLKGITVSEEKAKDDINGYRSANPLMVGLWNELKTAFNNCYYDPAGPVYYAGKIALIKDGTTIWMRLPSGRAIPHYSCFVSPEGNMGFWRAKFGAMMPQKVFGGSLLEISCFVGGTRVLTDSGLKRIDNVTVNDRIWDGCNWVSHRGAICQGSKSVTEVCGIRATPDHLILLSEDRDQWQRLGGLSVVNLKQATDLAASLLPAGFSEKKEAEGSVSTSWFSVIAVLQKKLKDGVISVLQNLAVAPFVFVNNLTQDTHKVQHGMALAIETSGSDFADRQLTQKQDATTPMHRLGNTTVGAVSKFFGHGTVTVVHQLLSGILQHFRVTTTQILNWTVKIMMAITNPVISSLSTDKQICSIAENLVNEKQSELVYDILDCGPKNRFMICSPDGRYLLAHNCQAMTRDIITACEDDIERELPDITLLLDIYDSVIALAPVEIAKQREEQMRAIMRRPRFWTEGLPLDAEGYSGLRMRK